MKAKSKKALLRKNPHPDDNQDSYWIVEIKDDIKSSFSRAQRNWKISEADDKDIRLFFKETKKDDSVDWN